MVFNRYSWDVACLLTTVSAWAKMPSVAMIRGAGGLKGLLNAAESTIDGDFVFMLNWDAEEKGYKGIWR